MLTIELAGEQVTLWADRAMSWARRSALLVADLHLGKPAAFRSAGVPAPEGTTEADLARLDRLLDATRAERLLILGDLLHARAGRAEHTMNAVADWALRLAQRGRAATLVRGNHDRSAGDPPPEWNIRTVDAPLIDGPFALAHEPQECPPGHYLLAGAPPSRRDARLPHRRRHARSVLLVRRTRGRAARIRLFHRRPRRATRAQRSGVRDRRWRCS